MIVPLENTLEEKFSIPAAGGGRREAVAPCPPKAYANCVHPIRFIAIRAFSVFAVRKGRPVQ
jgi:hypothetical protein